MSYSHAISIGVPAILAARIGTRLATRLPDDVHQLAFNAASFILVPLNLMVQQNVASKRDASDEGRGFVSRDAFPSRAVECALE